MIDKNIHEKEAQDLKKTYDHYLDKRKEVMKNTDFKVEDVELGKDNFSNEQKPELNNFSAEKNVNINFCLNINLSKPGKKRTKCST